MAPVSKQFSDGSLGWHHCVAFVSEEYATARVMYDISINWQNFAGWWFYSKETMCSLDDDRDVCLDVVNSGISHPGEHHRGN
jgi:hypothetical protein